MMKTKKFTGVLLSATMLVGLLAACSGGNNEPSPGTNGGESGDNGQPLTMSFFSADPSPNWAGMQDAIGKVITEKTGVILDAEYAVGDPVQKIALIAASGEYPDLISAKQDVAKLVDVGAMLDLTDLIEEHAPNIKALFGDYMKRLRYSEDDHAIYVIPTYAAVDSQNFNAGGGFGLQHRVVKELGFPEIRTVKDFENAIRTYLEKNPTDESGNKNIGLTLNSDDWRMYISVTNPAFATTGGSDDGEFYIDHETMEVTYHFRRPEEKEYFRWLNHMNATGLLDPETFVQKHDQYNAKVASGRVLGLIDQDWNYGDGENALKAEGKFDQTYGHYPVTMSEEYLETSFWPTGFMSGSGVGISVDNPDPVRAIKFLDYLASEEGQILANWGVEGEHYDVVDGKRVIPAEVNNRKVNDVANFQRETGISLYGNIGPHYGDGVLDSTGNFYTTNFPEQLIESYNEAEKEVLDAYGATLWKDLFPSEDNFPIKPWGAAWNIPIPGDHEVSVLDTRLRDITWKRIPEAILAKPEEFDAIWDAYMEELEKNGVERAEKGRQEFVEARVALWND